MQKNDEFIVTIENLGVSGEGVCKIDNIVVFVPFALPGEKVKIHILKVLKNFAYAKLLEVFESSSSRIEPKCPVFKKCGGCQLQHLRYNNQLEFKRELVQVNLKKIANIDYKVEPCVSSDEIYAYRNKLSIPIGEKDGKIIAGFYAPHSHNIVPTQTCYLQGEWANKIVCIVLKYIEKSGETAYSTMQTGNVRHLMCRFVDNRLMVCLITQTGKIKNSEILIEMIKQEFDNFSLYVNKNNSKSNVIFGNQFSLLYGKPEQQIENFDIKYNVSPQSFLQVNQCVQNKIYQVVLDEIEPNETIIDAYSGAGLLSAIVAKKSHQVFGIEIVPEATHNANTLAKQNCISNLTNICGDSAIELPKLVQKLQNQNVSVILDPPRKGCNQKVIQSLILARPNKIIYISCNSATLSRDIKPLLDFYDIKSITPFDMFPQTCHVETVAVLTLK